MTTKKKSPPKKTTAKKVVSRANTAANALGNGLAGRARDAIRARRSALSNI